MISRESSAAFVLSSPSLKDDLAFGRRSCEFSNQPAYCITKTSVNLKQLEECLLDFKRKFSQQETEFIEQTEVKLLKFNERKILNKPVKLEPISSGTALEVFSDDIPSIDHYESNAKQFELKKKELLEIPENQLVMLSNVRSLLERLDETCLKTKELLFKEKGRTAKLRETIDDHAYKRIHNLPVAVQREHEKCAYDIQELKWHCAYQGRTELRIKERVRLAENTNKRILEEIQFVKESSPLITEKQQREKQSMVLIQEKQDEDDGELKNARDLLDETERKFEQAKRKADQEEQFLAERLLSLSSQLKITLEKFLESQNSHSTMVETISSVQEKLTKSRGEETELNEKLLKIKQRQRNLEREVESLNERIFHEAADHKKLVEENSQLGQVKMEQEGNLDKMRRMYELSIQEKTKNLQRILKSNKSSQKEIHNLRRRIETSEKQKNADIKSVKRALEEKEKVVADLEVIMDETEETRKIHDKLVLQLEQEREKAIEIEDNLMMQVEALKKSNKEENHARMILQARINAESADLVKRKEEAERKKEKLIKAKQDVGIVVATVNAQVTKLGEKYQERIKALEALNNLITQLSEKHAKMEKNWNDKIEELGPRELELKESLFDLSVKEKEMESTSTILNKKLADMASSSIMMNKLLLANQNAIDELNEEIAELQIQLDSGNGLESTLRESLGKVQERSSFLTEQHLLQQQSRTQTLHDLKEEVESALKENHLVALLYMDLQNKHIDQKNQFISTYEKSLIAQDNLADKENLCDLHSRLHEALRCYYQLRGIQTKAGLSRFEEMTRKSKQKLDRVEKGLEVATSNITAFLSANNASHKHIHLMTKQRPVKLSA